MFKIKQGNTVRHERYYCILGISKKKVIYGSTPEIVHRRAVRAIEKGEVSFYPVVKAEAVDDEDYDEEYLPF